MVTKASDTVVRAVNSQAFDWNPDTTSGLEWGYYGGAWTDNNNYGVASDGTVTLPDDATTTVALDPTDGRVDTVANLDTLNSVPIAEIDTASGEVTDVTDLRTPFVKKQVI